MTFEQFLLNIFEIAGTTNHRQLLWLSGEQKWCYNQVEIVKHLFLEKQSILISDKESIDRNFSGGSNSQVCNTQVVNKETKKQLGKEFELVVFDCYGGFNPDYFAQIIGTLKAGGLILLITPEETEWSNWSDLETSHIVAPPFSELDVTQYFLSWLLTSLKQYLVNNRLETHCYTQSTCHLHSDVGLEKVGVDKKAQRPSGALISADDYRTALIEQNELVDQCCQFLIAYPFCHIVISAARGRGKSAALGLLANTLENKSIYVTSSTSESVLQIQRFSKVELDYRPVLDLLTLDESHIRDSILFIDEAASINIDILVRLTNKFRQIVFSTTTDGYEGTGQGFRLRFLKSLKSDNVEYRFFQLDKPMRWLPNDALERWVNEFLFLDSSTLDQAKSGYKTSEKKNTLSCKRESEGDNQLFVQKAVRIEKVNASFLIENPKDLQQLYTLLSQAHYKTTPSDLRIILDSPNIHIWVTYLNEKIIAACLLAIEGRVSSFPVDRKGMRGDQLAKAIYQGSRRPKGNLIPQILIAQEGMLHAKDLKFARIVRIATNDKYRRLNLAGQLIKDINHWCAKENCDFIGASFAIQNDLMSFWLGLNFQLIRVGNQLDKVTASYTCLFIKTVTPNENIKTNERLLGLMIRNFEYKNAYQSKGDSQLEYVFRYQQRNEKIDNVEQWLVLKKSSQQQLYKKNEEYKNWCLDQLKCFCYYHRSLESVDYIIHVILENSLGEWKRSNSSEVDIRLLTMYFFEQSSLDVIYAEFKFSGYRSFIKKMRLVCKQVFDSIKVEQYNGYKT